jgi:hypothetical protein
MTELLGQVDDAEAVAADTRRARRIYVLSAVSALVVTIVLYLA